MRSSVKVGRFGLFGLFVVLLGRISTGSSFSALASHCPTVLTTSYHFVPHLSCKSFIVKQKLDAGSPTPVLIRESTKACGCLVLCPQAVAFTSLVLSLFFRSDFS